MSVVRSLAQVNDRSWAWSWVKDWAEWLVTSMVTISVPVLTRAKSGGRRFESSFHLNFVFVRSKNKKANVFSIKKMKVMLGIYLHLPPPPQKKRGPFNQVVYTRIPIFVCFAGRLVNTPLVVCHHGDWRVYTPSFLGVPGVTVGWPWTKGTANNERVLSFLWIFA